MPQRKQETAVPHPSLVAVAALAALMSVSSGALAQSALSKGDFDFASKATLSNQLEIEVSRLGLTKATSPELKTFARQMIDDHTKAGNDLKAALRKANGPEQSESLDGSHQDELDPLSARNGADFDRAFVERQVVLHDEAVGLFSDYVKKASNPDLKAFAEKTLPVIEAHQTHVKALAKP